MYNIDEDVISAMADIDVKTNLSGRNRNNLHGDLHKRVRHEDHRLWLCRASKRLPKVRHTTILYNIAQP